MYGVVHQKVPGVAQRTRRRETGYIRGRRDIRWFGTSEHQPLGSRIKYTCRSQKKSQREGETTAPAKAAPRSPGRESQGRVLAANPRAPAVRAPLSEARPPCWELGGRRKSESQRNAPLAPVKPFHAARPWSEANASENDQDNDITLETVEACSAADTFFCAPRGSEPFS